MIFDPKNYLYYTVLNELYARHENSTKEAEKLIEILGNLELKPGDLKTKDKGINDYGKVVYAENVSAENENLSMIEFETNSCSHIYISGLFNHEVKTKIHTEFCWKDDNFCDFINFYLVYLLI